MKLLRSKSSQNRTQQYELFAETAQRIILLRNKQLARNLNVNRVKSLYSSSLIRPLLNCLILPKYRDGRTSRCEIEYLPLPGADCMIGAGTPLGYTPKRRVTSTVSNDDSYIYHTLTHLRPPWVGGQSSIAHAQRYDMGRLKMQDRKMTDKSAIHRTR